MESTLYGCPRCTNHPEDDVLTSIYTKGRDNARTPMQWDNGKHAGFSDSSPWIKLNPNYVSINAKRQLSEPESVFRYYQKLIALRKQHEIITEGRFHMLAKQSEELFCYERQFHGQRLLVLCNFYKEPAELPKEIRIPQNAEVLISNYNDEKPGQQLRPYEAVMMLITD